MISLYDLNWIKNCSKNLPPRQQKLDEGRAAKASVLDKHGKETHYVSDKEADARWSRKHDQDKKIPNSLASYREKIYQARKARMNKEETELNELSKKTLKSYYSKAKADAKKTTKDLRSNTFGAGLYYNPKAERKLFQRDRYIDKAKDKLTKKEETNLDEGYPSRKHFQQVADIVKNISDEKERHSVAHHHATIFKAQNPRFDHNRFMDACGVKCHVKEEALDEISKETLGSYVEKSHKDIQKKKKARDFITLWNNSDYKRKDKAQEKINKREGGFKKAIERLKKEETVNEISKVQVVKGKKYILSPAAVNAAKTWQKNKNLKSKKYPVTVK